MEVLNVNAPFAVIERLSPPLSCKTRPVPVSPVMVPRTLEEEEEDEFPLPVAFGLPLQPNRMSETAAIKSDFVKAFMIIVVLLVLNCVRSEWGPVRLAAC